MYTTFHKCVTTQKYRTALASATPLQELGHAILLRKHLEAGLN